MHGLLYKISDDKNQNGDAEVYVSHYLCFFDMMEQNKLHRVWHVLDWTGSELKSTGQKLPFFVPLEKVEQGGTGTRSRSHVCEKDVNTLLILGIEDNPRKFV